MIADPLWSCVMFLCGPLWVFCGSFVVLCGPLLVLFGPLRYLVIPIADCSLVWYYRVTAVYWVAIASIKSHRIRLIRRISTTAAKNND